MTIVEAKRFFESQNRFDLHDSLRQSHDLGYNNGYDDGYQDGYDAGLEGRALLAKSNYCM